MFVYYRFNLYRNSWYTAEAVLSAVFLGVWMDCFSGAHPKQKPNKERYLPSVWAVASLQWPYLKLTQIPELFSWTSFSTIVSPQIFLRETCNEYRNTSSLQDLLISSSTDPLGLTGIGVI